MENELEDIIEENGKTFHYSGERIQEGPVYFCQEGNYFKKYFLDSRSNEKGIIHHLQELPISEREIKFANKLINGSLINR